MSIVRYGSSALLLCSLALVPACHNPTYGEERPDPSSLVAGDTGIQSSDIIGITDQLAPTVLGIPEVAQNPNRITVVVDDMKNATRSRPGENLNIFTERLADNLAAHATAHVAFQARKAETQRLQQEEGGGTPDIFEEGSRNGVPAQTRRIPQFALQGTLFDQPNNSTTYYYVQFKLVNITTGDEVWRRSYDLKVRN